MREFFGQIVYCPPPPGKNLPVRLCAEFLQFKNFRPISNLKALSKIIEKSVALQLNNYLMNNNLHENFQSAYKVHHSTETVMVTVQDGILQKAVVLLMLELFAAFDTMSHEILLERLAVSTLWYYRVSTRMVGILPVTSYTICSY